MSETWADAMDSEAYDAFGEGAYDSEAYGEGAYDSEAYGDASDEGLGEESRSARRRRERQRQILLERQRQRERQRLAQRRPQRPMRSERRPVRPAGPSPRQTIAAVRSLDLDTKVELDSLRRAVEESNRRAARATWAAVASTSVDQGLASFFTDAQSHPYVAAGVRFAPLLFLSPEKKRGGVEGFATDPRVIGGAAILGIALLGTFRNRPQGVGSIAGLPNQPISVSISEPAGNPVLNAVALSRDGVQLPQTQLSWTSSNSNALAVDPSSGAMTPKQAGSSVVTAAAGGAASSVTVNVTE
jgi:hypothetical protein